MIRAVIFDCFGVLLTENWLSFKREKFGNDPEKFERASELNRMVDAGLMSDDSYIAEIAAMADMDPTEVKHVFRSVGPNRPVLDLISDIAKNHKIGVLSNISSDWFEELFSAEELALFDAQTLSYKIGVTKPDPRAYRIAANDLNESCENCLFIDDVEINVRAAKEQGMHGIVYRDHVEFIDALRRHGVL